MIAIRHFINRRSLLFIFSNIYILILPALPNTATAQSHLSNIKAYPVNFSLSFSQADIKLEGKDKTYSTDQRQISAYLENSINPSIHTGLNIGSSYIDLDNDPLVSAIHLNGNHIGLTIRGNTRSNPQLELRAYFLYQEARGSNALQSVSLTWFEWLTAVSIKIDLGSLWRLGIEGGIMGIDARRNISGDIRHKLKMKNDTSFQGQLKLDLNTDRDGRISMTINRGNKTGAEIAFSRDFYQ